MALTPAGQVKVIEAVLTLDHVKVNVAGTLEDNGFGETLK